MSCCDLKDAQSSNSKRLTVQSVKQIQKDGVSLFLFIQHSVVAKAHHFKDFCLNEEHNHREERSTQLTVVGKHLGVLN